MSLLSGDLDPELVKMFDPFESNPELLKKKTESCIQLFTSNYFLWGESIKEEGNEFWNEEVIKYLDASCKRHDSAIASMPIDSRKSGIGYPKWQYCKTPKEKAALLVDASKCALTALGVDCNTLPLPDYLRDRTQKRKLSNAYSWWPAVLLIALPIIEHSFWRNDIGEIAGIAKLYILPITGIITLFLSAIEFSKQAVGQGISLFIGAVITFIAATFFFDLPDFDFEDDWLPMVLMALPSWVLAGSIKRFFGCQQQK